jgi:NADH-quinone oxidoreductase subunit L
LAFLFACLGLSGFPISPTFIGEDLIFSHINPNEIGLAIIIALSFVLDGIAIVRIYARIFLGPHSKNYHSKAIRSS